MAATIKIKNSSTASAIPTSSDLVQGELAVNVTDKRLYTENASGTVVELGTNPATLTVTAGATIQGLTVGKGAGAVSTNTAVGASALAANTTGANNSSLGYEALNAITTNNNNTAVGYRALKTTTSGGNVAVGSLAALVNTTGTSLVAVGVEALTANSTGSYNTAIGISALQANTTASNNTAVGYQAGYSNTTGTYSTLIGTQAGYSQTTGYGTYIGYQAGYSETTGQFNTFIGLQSGYAMTTGSKNTIIGGYTGNQGGLDIRTSSNYIVLSDGDGNPRGIFDSSGNFLVGTTNTAQNAGVGIKLNNFASPEINVVGAASANNAGTSYHLYSTGAGAYRFYVGYGGTIYATSTTITGISDQRLKENIRDLDDGLASIMALQPRKFDWKEGKGADIKNARGFIAQEFEEVFPDLIDEWKDEAPEGEEPYKSVRADLIPVLVKAIQEQQAIIESLTARIEALENQA